MSHEPPHTHSPGPWQVFRRAEQSIYLFSKTNEPSVCIARIFTDEPDDGEANARLIAAAPDLLAALIEAKETIRTWHSMGETDDTESWGLYNSHAPEMKRLNAAIQKATLSIVSA